MAIILRTVKGASLTYEEMDDNLSQFSYSGSISKAVNQHTLYLHYTGSSGLGYVPRSESIDITPFPFEGIAEITGSLQVTGSIYYNGILLEELRSLVTSSVYTSYFTNQLTASADHNFGNEDVVVSVYDEFNRQILPQVVEIVDENTVRVFFNYETTGKIVVVGSGGSGSMGVADIIADPGIYSLLSGSSNIIGLDTASAHFQDAAYTYGLFRLTGSMWNTTNDLGITGSLTLNGTGVGNIFNVDASGSTQISINQEGIFTLTSQSTVPTPVAGGMYYGSDNMFYLGFY